MPKGYLISVIPGMVSIDHVDYENPQLYNTRLVRLVKASKESTRFVKSTRNKTKKQTRKINKFELLFILVMMTGSLILVL